MPRKPPPAPPAIELAVDPVSVRPSVRPPPVQASPAEAARDPLEFDPLSDEPVAAEAQDAGSEFDPFALEAPFATEQPPLEFEPVDSTRSHDPIQDLIELVALDPQRYERRMREAFDAQDFGRARRIAEALLALQPDHGEAKGFLVAARTIVEQQAASVRKDGSAVPLIVASTDVVRTLKRDPRKAFLLKLVDGESTIEEIVELCGMHREDALDLLAQLVEAGVLQLKR